MEPIPRDPGDDDLRRQQMIAAITEGVEAEDYAFVVEVAGGQDLLRPFEIVEYMDVKRRGSEDPVEQRRWGDGLGHYLTSLSGQEFPEDELEVINSVTERLNFDRVVSNEAVAEEPTIDGDLERSDADWRNDYFCPAGVDEGELDRLSKTPIGQSVVSYASVALRNNNAAYLERAIEAVTSFQFGSGEKLRKLLDVYIAKYAEKQAANALQNNNSAYLSRAFEAIQQFGSSEEAILALKGSLDKHIYAYAEDQVAQAIKNKNNAYIQNAADALRQYVSSEERIKAMLEELGLA
jgi:hypothetical protein